MTSRVRGPLRALHTNRVMDNSPSPAKMDRSVAETFDLAPPDGLATPVLRMTFTENRLPTLPYAFPAPLRASSYRADKHTTVPQTNEDIRSHFPIRNATGTKRCNDLNTKIAVTSSPSRTGLKRSADSEPTDMTMDAKITRFTDSHDLRPLTMGAHVKEHPRYARRSSGQLGPDHPLSTSRLSPVCTVPMPQGFPSPLINSGSAIALPWGTVDSTQNRVQRVIKRTVETQTSPFKDQNLNTSANCEQKQPKSKRQSFGSTQVLRQGLRQTFGQLRRAFSAERLHRVQTTNKAESPQPRVKLTVAAALSGRGSSLRLSRSKRRMSCDPSVLNEPKVDQPSRLSLSIRSNSKATVTEPEKVEQNRLSYHVLNKYSDGSFRVMLRRASIEEQFGFFIARDTQGIYISRLGSVRCAAKFWDTFHVGDRILEVQGVSCTQLDIDDVQNLIRKCELAEFRVRPANHYAKVLNSACLR